MKFYTADGGYVLTDADPDINSTQPMTQAEADALVEAIEKEDGKSETPVSDALDRFLNILHLNTEVTERPDGSGKKTVTCKPVINTAPSVMAASMGQSIDSPEARQRRLEKRQAVATQMMAQTLASAGQIDGENTAPSPTKLAAEGKQADQRPDAGREDDNSPPSPTKLAARGRGNRHDPLVEKIRKRTGRS